jgi:hypothetical protein
MPKPNIIKFSAVSDVSATCATLLVSESDAKKCFLEMALLMADIRPGLQMSGSAFAGSRVGWCSSKFRS